MINPRVKPSEKAPKSNPNLPIPPVAAMLTPCIVHSTGFLAFRRMLAPMAVVTMPKTSEAYVWNGDVASGITSVMSPPSKPIKPPIKA